MQLTIFQQVILGIIQGITEWIPVSSSGFVTLVMTNFFGITDLGFLLHSALLLHLGTFFAALVYFRKDVAEIFKTLFKYRYSNEANKRIFKFLAISTIISGIIGLIILKLLTSLENNFETTGKTITLFVGALLLLTGVIQIKTNNKGLREVRNLKNSDGIVLGFAQGFASLPGISRSGITISTLLLKKFDDTTALRLSFLMSLPIVLVGNILLNFQDLLRITNSTYIYGLLVAFVFGLLTISGLMKLSKKINFGWFVLIFALVMLGSLLI
jgi:undecaprenyl-diphosphatase